MRNIRLVFASVVAATLASAGTIIVPIANATTEGGPNEQLPFGHSEMQLEQIYSSTEFGSSPITITGIAFRPDAVYGLPASYTIANFFVELSTTSASTSTMSTSFAANLGSDATVVYSGNYLYSTANTDTGTGTKNFDIVITFAVPFVYDPSAGNLLIYMKAGTGGADNPTGGVVDATTGNFIYALNTLSETGSNTNVELVAEFLTDTPLATVPEPSTLALFAVGLTGVLTTRRLRRRR